MNEEKDKMKNFPMFWLDNLFGIGKVKISKLTDFFGGTQRLYEMITEGGRDELRDTLLKYNLVSQKDAETILNVACIEKLKDKYLRYVDEGIRMVSYEDEDYPAQLKNIYSSPYMLYYKGNLPRNDKKNVAVVGSRNCSEYGRKASLDIGYDLAMHGIQVISGFARGVDTFSHRGCLRAGGETFAVFGCGVNICYPSENAFMYDEILESGGGIISEVSPDTKVTAGLFPLRNRIISGLAEVIIVVEAGAESGSLITVEHALGQNRTVMVVPGRITDRLSKGCNNLIRQGAAVYTEPKDVLFELGIDDEKYDTKITKTENSLASTEKMLYSLMDFSPVGIDELMRQSELQADIVLQTLVKLELMGYIRETSKGYFVRIK